jgi:hypothetical protein
MNETLSIWHIAGGGALAVIVIREVFGFVKAMRNGNGKAAGSQSVEFWKMAIGNSVEEGVTKANEQYFGRIIDRLDAIKDAIKELKN